MAVMTLAGPAPSNLPRVVHRRRWGHRLTGLVLNLAVATTAMAETSAPQVASGHSCTGLEQPGAGSIHGSVRLHAELPEIWRARRAQSLNRFVNAWHDELARLVPTTHQERLGPMRVFTVLLLRDSAAYGRFTRRCAPERSGNSGYYDGLHRLIVSHLGAPPSVLRHELAHAVLGDHLGDPAHRRLSGSHWPIWLEEGLAEYAAASVTTLDTGEVTFGVIAPSRLATALDLVEGGASDALTLGEILEGSRAAFVGDRLAAAYSTAWALTQFLISNPHYNTAWTQLSRHLGTSPRLVTAPGVPLLQASARVPLEHALAQFVRTSAESEVWSQRLLGTGHAMAERWTMHGATDWRWGDMPRVGGGGVIGVGSAMRTSFLTRAVLPTHGFEMVIRYRSGSPKTSLGVVLGYHGATGYPFHTLVDFGPRRTRLRHIANQTGIRDMATTASRHRPGRWYSARLILRRGYLTVETSEGAVVSAPLQHRGVSLVGLFVDQGRGYFREMTLLSQAPP